MVYKALPDLSSLHISDLLSFFHLDPVPQSSLMFKTDRHALALWPLPVLSAWNALSQTSAWLPISITLFNNTSHSHSAFFPPWHLTTINIHIVSLIVKHYHISPSCTVWTEIFVIFTDIFQDCRLLPETLYSMDIC